MIFPSAATLRQSSLDDLKMFREIRIIEEDILISKHAGGLSSETDQSNMTKYLTTITTIQNSEQYFINWQAKNTTMCNIEMDYVIQYFTNLGYKILRKTNPATNKTFVWSITW